ncbi:serine protease [Flavobacteriales bacterium 34_180_T64]|nr:serine protease [Flavobacteriales bacterium 34_180_T64]
MKKILTLVLVSVLGGVITLSAYKLWFDIDVPINLQTQNEQPVFIPTNNKTLNTNLTDTTQPNFVNAADKTIHAVVHVKNTSSANGPTTFEDLFYGRSSKRPQIGTGSGVIISPDGYIITNNHVIDGSQELSITLNDNKIYNAELIGTDVKTDIALLKIETDEELPFITFGNSDDAQIGEWVLAVGNPFNLTSTVTAGIISAKSRNLTGQNTQSFIQTDAAVNPGNSGGALVNTNGDLIGINTAISSQTGSYIGYSFAVPSNIARKVVEDIMEFGDVQNGILGVRGGTLNSKSAEQLEVNTSEGFYISDIEEDSGAEKAGLKQGDIIKKVDEVKISKFADLSGYLSTKRPNDVVNVTLLRDEKETVIPVTLFKNQTTILPIVGNLKNAKPEDLEKFKLNHGVKISRLNSEYSNYWKRNGIQEGSIITVINDVKINSVEDVDNVLKKRTQNEALRIEIINTNGEKERFNFR